MITSEDVIAKFPHAADFDEEILAEEVRRANNALPDERFKSNPDHGRVLFVMHRLEKPTVAAELPKWLRIARSSRAQNLKKPHPWSGTKHGDHLRKMTHY
jgi:hypothetical protein